MYSLRTTSSRTIRRPRSRMSGRHPTDPSIIRPPSPHPTGQLRPHPPGSRRFSLRRSDHRPSDTWSPNAWPHVRVIPAAPHRALSVAGRPVGFSCTIQAQLHPLISSLVTAHPLDPLVRSPHTGGISCLMSDHSPPLGFPRGSHQDDDRRGGSSMLRL